MAANWSSRPTTPHDIGPTTPHGIGPTTPHGIGPTTPHGSRSGSRSVWKYDGSVTAVWRQSDGRRPGSRYDNRSDSFQTVILLNSISKNDGNMLETVTYRSQIGHVSDILRQSYHCDGPVRNVLENRHFSQRFQLSMISTFCLYLLFLHLQNQLWMKSIAF